MVRSIIESLIKPCLQLHITGIIKKIEQLSKPHNNKYKYLSITRGKELILTYANPTKSRTSTYHPTIDWVEPNISFNQSSPCHIPSMNVGSHGIINQNQTRASRCQTTSTLNQ